jgi:hypothetical protein
VPCRSSWSPQCRGQKSNRLEQAGGADATTLRDAYAYAISYEPIVQELLALAKFLAHSIRVQRNEAGLCALDVYNLAKRLSQRKDGAELKPFVDDMRTSSVRDVRGRRIQTPSSPPVPVPRHRPRKSNPVVLKGGRKAAILFLRQCRHGTGGGVRLRPRGDCDHRRLSGVRRQRLRVYPRASGERAAHRQALPPHSISLPYLLPRVGDPPFAV